MSLNVGFNEQANPTLHMECLPAVEYKHESDQCHSMQNVTLHKIQSKT